MKKLALFLALVMALTSLGLSAFAEEAETAARVTEYILIPAEGEQAELGYVEGTAILEVDGLKFKDMNDNGTLDVYEDWRVDTEERITDLLSQMTTEEKAYTLFQADMPTTLGASEEDGLETIWNYVVNYGTTHSLNNNWSGTPDEMTELHNGVQAIGESTRLGIPVTVTSDRQYNVWAGYTDTAHDAFATANNVELAYELWKHNAQEVNAVGIHVVLQPYGVEIGAWNGENPEYIAKMISAEVSAIYSEDVYACVKHFITRGGDASFSGAKSVAENLDNYLYCWQAAIDAGAQWIMTNGTGVGNLTVDYDPESMSLLRDTLGYDGVVITDWGAINTGANGITEDGVDLSQLSLVERYARMIGNGVDQVGINLLTLVEEEAAGNRYWIPGMVDAIEQGLLSAERVDEACRRLMRTKFNLGLFENPYNDSQAALAISASEEYIAEPWEITNIEELSAARNQDVVEMERQLQAESAVLVKNDGVLPLGSGAKVYIDNTNGTAIAEYKEKIGQYGAVVETMEEADVIVADLTQLNDAAELIVEDAKASGKPLLIVTNCVDPDAWVMENGDAVLFMNFNRTPDHGKAIDGLVLTTEPTVYAELLFGVREPSGMIVKEIARDADMDTNQWQDLANDMGVSTDVRMILEAVMLTSEDKSTPNNYSDALIPYEFSMRYNQPGEFSYTTFVVPSYTYDEQYENAVIPGLIFTRTVTANVEQKSGEPFTVYCLVWNNGGDDVTTVEVKDGDTVIAEKLMAVHGGSWRVVKLDVTLTGAGDHTLSIGGLSQIIPVAE